MKKLLSILLVSLILLQSCATLCKGVKQSIILVDLPENLKVFYNKQQLDIEYQRVGRRRKDGIATAFYYPGATMKIKKGIALELKHGDKTATVPVISTYKVVDIIQGLAGNIFTAEIGFLVDFSNGALRSAKDRFIDVPAILNGTKPRTQKELYKICMGLKQ